MGRRRDTLVLMACGLLGTLLGLCAVLNADEPSWDWTEPAPHHQAAVRVMAGDRGGSGTYVAVQELRGVITAAHVIGPAPQATVIFHDGTEVTGNTWQDKHGKDVGFVVCRHPSVSPLEIAAEDAGGPYEIMGFGGPRNALRHFRVQSRRPFGDYTLFEGFDTQGDSGGGILDRDGRLVGVLATGSRKVGETTEGLAVYQEIGSETTATIYAFAQRVVQQEFPTIADEQMYPPTGKPVLYVLSAKGCPPCDEFKRSGAPQVAERFDIRYVVFDPESDSWSDPAVVAQFEQATGQRKREIRYPTFWRPGSREYRVGYTVDRRKGLLEWLFNGLIWNTDPVQPQLGETAPLPPGEEPPPTPKPAAPEVDWSLVKIVVLIPQLESIDGAKGLLLSLVEKRATGPLRRAVSEISGGKAAADIVFERYEPVRFSAVAEAAGVTGMNILVLVREHNQTGIVRDIIIGKVEGKVADKLENAPIEVIFERLHPGDFAAIEKALAAVDAPAEEFTRDVPDAPPTSLVDDLKTAAKDAAVTAVQDWASEKLPGLIPKPEKQPADDSVWGESYERWGITGLLAMALLNGGWKLWLGRKLQHQPKPGDG